MLLKLENDVLRMMLPLVVVGCIISSLSVRRAATTVSAWIMQPPRLADTAEWGLFHLQREADHYAKQLEGTQKYINEQCRCSCPYRWVTMQLL